MIGAGRIIRTNMEDELIEPRYQHLAAYKNQRRGFTLVELLVVIAVISLLLAISFPALSKAKRKARTILSMNNQKQITSGLNFFALDNDDLYPHSVATVGFGVRWNWSDPTKLTGNRKRSPGLHRSMSAYLHDYIPDADTMYCPNAPRKYKYLQQSWDAGDQWDNPETSFPSDPVGGTYCFYFNYIGYLGGRRGIFQGPRGPADARTHSKLLVTDYFGYDHWRNPGAYSSCEKFNGADITPETWLLSAFFYRTTDPNATRPDIKLQAGYTDGHVESYSSSDVVPMKVSITSDGRTPYPDGVGPGIFYLPKNALH